MTDHPSVHVYVHISIYYTLLWKWAILTEGVWVTRMQPKARQFSCRIRGGSQTEGSISGIIAESFFTISRSFQRHGTSCVHGLLR